MKGRQILIEPLPCGGHAAALMVDGRLADLLLDPPAGEATPRPESIWRGVAGRPMKGMGGVMVELGASANGGPTGWLRGPKLPAPGRPLLVQVSGWAEPGKAPPVTTRVLLKGRTAILTPGAPGQNVARSLRDAGRRAALEALAAREMAGAEGIGLIVRSAAEAADDGEIAAEIAGLRADWAALDAAGVAGAPGMVRAAPGAAAEAMREWFRPGDAVREAATALLDAGVWEEVDALGRAEVALGDASMAIEPTRAFVAVDVNTGRDGSPAAALKANLAAVRELPRQLRLRGLGGQVVVDFAPLSRADRPRIEQALAAALKADAIETTVLGWTPGGNLELQRKRARRPLGR